MKLSDIRTFVAGNPRPGNGGRYFVFVKLTTDGNVHGVGEAYCVPFHPEVVARMLVDVFERYFRGADPHDIETLWRRVYSSGYTQHSDLSLMAVLSALVRLHAKSVPRPMNTYGEIGATIPSASMPGPESWACITISG